MDFVMMVGLPGSGKSTYANSIREDYIKYCPCFIFSSDAYRLKILKDETDQSNNALVFNTLYRDMIYTIENATDNTIVIFDATNISRKDRKRCLERLKGVKNFDKFKKIAAVMNTNIQECISRDAERNRIVGPEVINNMSNRYTFPEKSEGFDSIITIKN